MKEPAKLTEHFGVVRVDHVVITAALIEFFARRHLKPGPEVTFAGIGRLEDFHAELQVLWSEGEEA